MSDKYVAHDYLRLSHDVLQCKRCGLFVVEILDGPDSYTRYVDQDGVELANKPHCVLNEAA